MPTYRFEIKLPAPIPEDVVKVKVAELMKQLLAQYGVINIKVDVTQQGVSSTGTQTEEEYEETVTA